MSASANPPRHDFLLELLSEEIPARMQDKARDDLARLFADEIAKAGLAAAAIETYATPRRLALIARGLPRATAPVSEELKGPRATAPPQALEGFLRKTGLAREALVERDGVFFAVLARPGRATADVLADAVPAIVRGFPWPKSMRWGDGTLRWVRPLAGIVALLGEEVVPLEIDGVASAAATVGHRFHHPGLITIGSADDYAFKLRAAHVVVDQDERRRIIRTRAATLAAAAGLSVIPDEGLVAENAGLTEWPVPLLGAFDPAFLDLPREVIQLTMRTNQKYFACADPQGRLAPNFVCTANIDAADGGAGIVAGNQKVLSARLADAKFFWEQDLNVPLDKQAEKLTGIVFHEKLGTVADKVKRVAKLARWLVEEGIVGASPSPLRGEGRTGLERGDVGADAPPSPLRGEGRGEGPRGAAERPAATAEHPHPTLSLEGEGSSPAQAEPPAPPAPFVPSEVGRFGMPAGGDPTTTPPFVPSEVEVRAPSAPPAARPSTLRLRSGEPALGTNGADTLADHAERAARLCKADLVTGMVGEFPELQGTIGGYLAAAAEGEHPAVAAAIRDHYKPVPSKVEGPVGQDDEVPTDPVTVAVSLADKLDTLVSFYFAAEYPSGSRDPFALRRAALAIIRILADSGLRLRLLHGVAVILPSIVLATLKPEQSLARANKRKLGVLNYFANPDDPSTFNRLVEEGLGFLPERVKITKKLLLDFFADRLKVQQREAGVRHDLIDAVFALGREDDLVRLLARVRALQAFVATADGANLLAGYKRAANILRIEEKKDAAPPTVTPAKAGVHPSTGTGGEADTGPPPLTNTNQTGYTPLPEEAALLAALDAAEPAATRAVEAEDFAGAMTALAGLRAPIDAFFDKVTVNDPEPGKRAARLALLARIRDAVHRVADFSRIEG